jgi:AraC family transcriptional activator of pobA
MSYTDTKTVIPKFALDPGVIGNKMFNIKKADGVQRLMPEEFLAPHRKDYYFFAYVKQGSNRHWIDTQVYTLKPDSFYFTVPHQVHLKESSEPFKGFIIGFTEEFLLLEGNDRLRQLPVIQNPHNGHELDLLPEDLVFLDDILNKIHAEYIGKSNWQHSMLLAYTQVMLIYISRLYTTQVAIKEQMPGRTLLKRYLFKIEESFTELHDVAAYADMLNVSAGHLSETVKQQSGKPAIMHIHERLMLEAKRLLFHTELSVKEISFQLGFEDASYFNRFFKRTAELTPAEYRASTREMYH